MNKKTIVVLFALALMLSARSAQAGSATWKPHPNSGDWNSAANWRPRTIPNGPNDTATFGVSDTADVSLPKSQIEVNGLVFNPGASAFSLNIDYTSVFILSGAGITNNSGVVQNFAVTGNYVAGLIFNNQATAGIQTIFTAGPDLGQIDFHDEATASSATFSVVGTEYYEDGAAGLGFYDNSTAANAVITNTGGSGPDSQGGYTSFRDDSTAANANITNERCTDSAAYYGGATGFSGNATAADALITNQGGDASFAAGYSVFLDNATAGNAVITTNGGTGGESATLDFYDTSNAANATLIATGGSNGSVGGTIHFRDTSDSRTARVELFGNGTLDISNITSLGVNIGSLEGDGIVLLGAHTLTISMKSLSTEFSGIIQGSGNGIGTIVKKGSGTLTLSGANTYTGYTIVNGGFLRAENRTGSAAGYGPLLVYSGGTLGGSGILANNVVLYGGSLAPGSGATTLTVKGRINFNTGTYLWRVRTTSARADKIVAPEVHTSYSTFTGLAIGNATLPPGTTFTAINNTSSDAIDGTFSNLPDGGTLTIGNNTYQANYEGGDGNDLTLTVVAEGVDPDRR